MQDFFQGFIKVFSRIYLLISLVISPAISLGIFSSYSSGNYSWEQFRYNFRDFTGNSSRDIHSHSLRNFFRDLSRILSKGFARILIANYFRMVRKFVFYSFLGNMFAFHLWYHHSQYDIASYTYEMACFGIVHT